MISRILSILAAGGYVLAAYPASTDDTFTIQLKWVTHAQFAGLFLAKTMRTL